MSAKGKRLAYALVVSAHIALAMLLLAFFPIGCTSTSSSGCHTEYDRAGQYQVCE